MKHLVVPGFPLLKAGLVRHAVCLLSLAAACSGGPSGSNSGDDSGGSAGDNGGSGGNGGQDVPNTMVADCTPSKSKRPVDPMRRLTVFEFDNAAEDLLGDKRRVARDLLPGDEITNGYATNAQVTVQLGQPELFGKAARSLAEEAVKNMGSLVPCSGNGQEEACAMTFIRTFGRRAFRRPLSDDEVNRYGAMYKTKRTAIDHAQGIRLVVETMLQSPSYLYRYVTGESTSDASVKKLTGYEIASRLSFFLWSSIPDAELLDAAEKGDLGTTKGISTQVARMVRDGKFDRTLQSFAFQWLNVGETMPDKDPMDFPAFTDETWVSARSALARFFSDTVKDSNGDLKTLLTSNMAFVDANLAPLYGVTYKGSGLQSMDVDKSKRAGLMTQVAVMAARATSVESSPVKRGVYARNRLFCQDPPPPPGNVPPFEANATNLTVREQLEAHRANPTCASCHSFFDPLGLAFEHYDAVGVYRAKQAGKDIDASGSLTETDVDGSFKDALELLAMMKQSKMVGACLSTQFLRFAIGRLDGDTDTCVIKKIGDDFAAGGFKLATLFGAIAQSDSFRFSGTN